MFRISARRIRAFTLIELLMVIAIIGLLVGILMPALWSARAKGKLTVCASNLRQVGMGFMSYMRSSNDVFPYASFMPSMSSLPVQGDPIFIAEVLAPHVGNSMKVFQCPQDANGAARPAPNAGKTYFESEKSSYAYRTRPSFGGKSMQDVVKSLARFRGQTVNENTIWIMCDYDNFHAPAGAQGARRYLYYDCSVTDFEN